MNTFVGQLGRSCSLSFILLLFFLGLSLSGCQKDSEQPKTPSAPPAKTINVSVGLQTPLEAAVAELPSEAIPFWRQFKEVRPALVLYSSEPFLQPIPEVLQAAVQRLATVGSMNEIAVAGPFNANTTFLPGQAVSAALQADLFSRIIWVVPRFEEEKSYNFMATVERLREAGYLSKEEAEAFEPTKSGVKGQVRNVPFEVTDQFSLPAIDGSVVIHIDLTFFRDAYKNEVKTPLYELIYNTFDAMHKTEWQVAGATISLSTSMEAVSLDARFIGKELKQLFSAPDMLSQPMPKFWQMRRNVLYIDTFFQPEEMLRIYQDMAKLQPADASIYFGLYKVSSQLKSKAAANENLEKAIQLDPGYFVEYINIAANALDRGNVELAIDGYIEAAKWSPENPFLHLSLAKLYLEKGDKKKARESLLQIKDQDWSPVYYKNLSQEISEMLASTQKG